jgi:hypothetical protein
MSSTRLRLITEPYLPVYVLQLLHHAHEMIAYSTMLVKRWASNVHVYGTTIAMWMNILKVQLEGKDKTS